MPITVEVPNRGSIEFADGTSDADIDAIVAKEFPPTQEDSYQKVLGYEQSISDEVPTKEEFLAYNKVKKEKPLLGERPMETVAGAAVETGKFLATLPYRAGEAISETVIAPPEGVTRGEAVAGTAAEVASQAALGFQRLTGGIEEFITQKLKNDDDKYEAFLRIADIKRKLAAAQNLVPEQRVPASQDFLQMFNIPQEAISPAGTEVGGFVSAPENIAFGVGGKVGGALLGAAARQIPRVGARLQGAGAAVGNVARMPETLAGRAATALTGSEAAGEAVQRAVATGTTGLTAAEAFGVPVSGTLGVPGVGAASQFISGTKAAGAIGETLGEAAAASGGAGLTPIQQAMLGFGERIAASPTASTAARRLGTAIARTGIETPVKAAASILIPGLGAGAAGGLLAGLSGEEGDNVAAAIGSGIAFGGIEGGLRLAKASAAKGFDNARVRQAVVEDLNTRPNDVQFTYVDPVAGDQTVTIKDRDARAEFYNKLKGEQLPKALSEIANAENAGVEVLFHKSGDPIPQGIQQIKYKGVALKPADVRGGRPTILINVDAASPETIPHELLHARLTDDIVRRAGANVVQDSFDAQTGKITQQGQQFQDFANSYATAIEKAGDPTGAARFRQELATGFDNTLQRPQRIEALKRLSDEMMAYYAQEFLAGKDPKTILPGRIPSFWKNAFDLAKNAVADRFSQRALQAGFDPVARTFYDANGKRIKIPWMEDAINQLIVKGEGFTPREQKVDLRGLTPAARNAVIADRGYADLFMLNPDGSFGRPLTAREVQINDARIAQSTIKLLDSLPQADRASVTGLDAKGNTIIEGRLSLKEAEALANSGIFSTSTSQFIKDIANAIINGDLLNSRYWKVYGKTGRAGVFPEVEKAILPYGISINSKGGVNVKVVDWTKVQSRMDKALKKSAYRNLFRSQDQAMSALLDVYLKNIAEKNAVPSAEALGGGADGARKRNFFNEVMGAVPKVGDVLINQPTAGYTASRKGGSVYEDLRIERVQDIEQTGIKVPWSGDMGEQSSYRRTQLNFQPAERVGDASVQTDQNAGYRILSKNNKFRVYSPSGELAGIFDTEGQAKLKAEKLYATKTRLQPEIDQLQRPARNEVRQTAEAGGRNRPVSRTQGSQEGGEVNAAVRQAGDVVGNFDALVASAPEVRFMPIESQPENAPVSGRLSDGQRASIDELSSYYAQKTPERVKVLRAEAVDSLASRLVNKGVPVQDANAIASKTFSKIRKGVSGALQVISGMGLSDLSRMAGTGKPTVERRPHINPNWLTSAFEAFATDEGLALMKAQQVATQLNKAEQAKVAAGESVEAAKASGVRQSTMQQGMEFVLGEMNADRKAFGSSLREDLNSPPRVYASVLEGQKFGSQGNYNVFFEWKTQTPMVVTSHHHYGVANGVTGIHAQGNVGDKNARSFGNPANERFDTLPSGKQVLDTHLLVGNEGVPDARAHQLTVSIPESALANIRKAYKERGVSGVDAELNKIAVSQMVGSASQGKTFSYTTKEGIPPMVAIQRNRTEAYVLDPDLSNVGAVTIVSNSPKEVALIKKNLQKAFENNGSQMPKVKVVSAESGASKNPGRKAITDEYFKLTGQPRFMPSDTDYLAAVQAGDNQAAQQMVDQAAKAAGKSSIDIARGSSGFREMAKEIDNLPDDAVISVFTATSPKTAEGFLSEGVISEEKSYNLTGSFEPGRGLDRGLYVSDSPLAVEGYGRVILKVKVPKGRIAPSTEGVRLGYNTTGLALGNSANGAVISGDISPSLISKWEGDRYDRSPIEISYPAITRDDSGNVIPLSQRFQQSSADIRYMPQPDPSVPGAYSVTGGFRILPGKTKGRLRVYGPSGALVGIAGSLDEAQRMIRKKTQSN